MTPDIKKFLNEKHAVNRWLQSKTLDVYVRKGRHLIEGQIQRCFDVANISVPPDLQRQGIFKRWLAEVEEHLATTDIHCVFVESIIETGLIPFLERNGYKYVARSNPPSMYKMV